MNTSALAPAPSKSDDNRDLTAYVLPFGLFMLALAAVGMVQGMASDENAPFWMREPMYWIYPAQAMACAAALIWGWSRYDFGAQRGIPLAVIVGLAVFFLWVSPQMFFGQPQRTDGFNPTVFGEDAGLFWLTVLGRFFRLVIVVPIMEEVFWRGFLMRYLISERFRKVEMCQYTHLSFWAVTVLFALAHWGPDLIPAVLTGAIFGWVTIKTRSLTAVIVCHAVTNLALGIYIMLTSQWGFW